MLKKNAFWLQIMKKNVIVVKYMSVLNNVLKINIVQGNVSYLIIIKIFCIRVKVKLAHDLVISIINQINAKNCAVNKIIFMELEKKPIFQTNLQKYKK